VAASSEFAVFTSDVNGACPAGRIAHGVGSRPMRRLRIVLAGWHGRDAPSLALSTQSHERKVAFAERLAVRS